MRSEPQRPRDNSNPLLDPVIPETDEQLGIGIEDNPMMALLSSPQINELIERAVAARLAAVMGSGAQLPVAAGSDGAMHAVVAGIEKLVQMHATQQPGYARPLPAGVVEDREAGFAEMNTLLRKFQQSGFPDDKPRYLLVNEPLFAGEIEYPPGATITTWLYPNEHMAPLNDAARLVHKAMMRWIGGPQEGIAERVARAEAERNGRPMIDNSPFKPAGLTDASPVDMVEPPPEVRAFDPRRPPQAAHQMPQGVYTV